MAPLIGTSNLNSLYSSSLMASRIYAFYFPLAKQTGLTEGIALWYNADMDKRTIIFAALAFVVMMNIASFALMGHDKRCARLNSRRGSKSGKGWTPDGSSRRFGAQRRRQGAARP